MNRKILFLAFFLLAGLSVTLFAQSPQAFKYQAIARDAAGLVLGGTDINFQITLLEGSPAGPPVYTETHFITTNAFGLANLEIGRGTIVSGDFTLIDWASNTYYLQVEMDETGGTAFSLMGTAQLLSVPYALHAATSGSSPTDMDTDSTNELQAISFSGDTLYLSDGGQVFLGDYMNTDTQMLSLSGADLSISNGNTITLTDNVDDADADASNELQAISFSGDTLYLSDGGSVYLGGLSGDSDWVVSGSNMYSGVSGNVGIGTPTPVLPLHILNSGNTGILLDGGIGSDVYLNYRIPGSNEWFTGVDGADGDKFKISESGAWANTRLCIDNGGNVGIGTTTPTAKLYVEGNIWAGASGDFVALSPDGVSTSATMFADDGSVRMGARGGHLRFLADPSTAFNTERMRLTSTGDLGIGTTTPTEKLVVAGNANVDSVLTAGNIASGRFGIPGTITVAAGGTSGPYTVPYGKIMTCHQPNVVATFINNQLDGFLTIQIMYESSNTTTFDFIVLNSGTTSRTITTMGVCWIAMCN